MNFTQKLKIGTSTRCKLFAALLLLQLGLSAQAAPQNVDVAVRQEGKVSVSSHFTAAIREYERALRVDRNCQPALQHLAETYILYGKSLEGFPLEALKQFHRAYYFDNANPEIEALIDICVRRLGLNPESFGDRRALGEAAFERGDFVDSVIELKMARKISDDVKVDKNLKEAQNKLLGTLYAGRLEDVVVEGQTITTKDNKTDFGPYMDTLQRRINVWWKPPASPGTLSCTVIFKVDRDGTLKDLRLDKSSGDSKLDLSALDAVNDAAPFSSFNVGTKKNIEIKFAFTYSGRDGRWSTSTEADTTYRGAAHFSSLAR